MKFLIAVFLPASLFIPTSPFINFRDFCQPPRLLFWPKFASLPVYSALPFYLKLESIYDFWSAFEFWTSKWCFIYHSKENLIYLSNDIENIIFLTLPKFSWAWPLRLTSDHQSKGANYFFLILKVNLPWGR